MRSPHALRNGESPTSRDLTRFHSTVAAQKLCRFNSIIFLLLTRLRRLHAHQFQRLRFTSLLRLQRFQIHVRDKRDHGVTVFEMGSWVWEFSRETTLQSEAFQVWLDFGHDQ
ncbi:hypothetical protein N665_0165s0032 [Sinapis alba]|nr:hypothetical protein N665_0165s0032 [Sinapis alba]KAF8104946.1 hypothetical protein N665_0165s0032 [Sinapis alba]